MAVTLRRQYCHAAVAEGKYGGRSGSQTRCEGVCIQTMGLKPVLRCRGRPGVAIQRIACYAATVVTMLAASASAQSFVTEFTIAPYSYSADIIAGPDGNLWFPETYANKIVRSSWCLVSRLVMVAPRWALVMAPAISAPMAQRNGRSGSRASVRLRVTRAALTVIKLTARLSVTARCAAYPSGPTSTGNRNSAPPRPMRPPSVPIGTA